MPSAITAQVEKGIVTEFPDFARLCTRLYRPFQDMPLDGTLPERIEPDIEHTRKSLELAVAELNTVAAWDGETADTEANKWFLSELKEHLQSVRRDRQLKGRYILLLAQVEAWQPPTEEHSNLKDSMENQLTESMRGLTTNPDEYRPQRLSGQEFKESRVKELAHRITFYTQRLFEEQDSADSLTSWLQDLQESLDNWRPIEPPTRQLP